jgi:hypothetical protein
VGKMAEFLLSIVFWLKSVEELYYSPQIGINRQCGHCSRLPKGKNCMGNANLLPNNPARQLHLCNNTVEAAKFASVYMSQKPTS